MTADQNLAPEQYPEMNRRFFAPEKGPSAYLRHRLRALLLGASQDERIKAASADGLRWQTLNLKVGTDSDLYDEDSIAQFVTLDATVLLHHAAESFMRLYFAVANLPECPWLEINRLRAGAFTRELQRLISSLDEPSTRQKLLRALTGFASHEEMRTLSETARRAVPMSEGEWEANEKAVMLLVSHTARLLINDANGYNAAKHGLAVRAGDANVRLGDGEVLSASGPSIGYLEMGDNAAGEKRWRETTAWVQADRTLGLVHVVLDRLETMWSVARTRYAQIGGFSVAPLPMEHVKGVIGPAIDDERGYTIDVQKMSVQLLYYELPEALGGPPDPGRP